MSPRAVLVASSTSDLSTDLLLARFRRLLDEGWDAYMVVRDEERAKRPGLAEAAAGGRVELFPVEWKDQPYVASRLAELRPDLVHFHSAWQAKRLTDEGAPEWGVVVSLREDGQDLAVSRPETLWQAADHFIYPSQASLDRALGRGWPAGSATVMPAPPAVPAPRRKREDPSEPLRVLSSGPVLWEHGLEHAVQGVSLAVGTGVEVEYRILGEGEHIPAVAFARHQLGVADRVELLHANGPDRLAAELERTDVVLDAAVTDSAVQTALDSAVLAGIPFVATEREAPLPAGAGIVVPRRDPGAVAEALARLARDPALGRGMSAVAGHTANQALERHLDELLALYRGVLEARAA